MAPTTSDASASTLSMKLLVDTKAGRVLYAEASKDVVDFLFSLLTLPVGTVVKILSKDVLHGRLRRQPLRERREAGRDLCPL
ncbi:unnamed protein product [Urochloa humidicola]